MYVYVYIYIYEYINTHMCACTHRYLYIQKKKTSVATGEKANETCSSLRGDKDIPIFINTNVRFPFFNENIEGKKSPTYKV